MSSDGGGLLLKAVDDELGLTAALANCLRDNRQAGKITHTLQETFAQRVFGIALGYPDANDADALANDPIHKLMIGRDPILGERLASQPTISRMENAVGPGELLRMSEALAASVIQRHRRRKRKVRRITIDLDPTEDPTHGGQQLSFFNRLYDHWCYLPVAGFLSFDNEPDQ